ncbi:MAG TPA: transposase family protein, partial [Dehalococcoidia bacterium]|nr:transposase family protein [Dehalococcoidia bacterium]
MADKWVNVESIGSYFQSLCDPRHVRNRKHLLLDVVVISICAMVCGSDGPTAIHRWATNRQDWLNQFLALPNGIPSRDCIRRLLMALSPDAFQRCFQGRIADAVQSDHGGGKRLIAID